MAKKLRSFTEREWATLMRECADAIMYTAGLNQVWRPKFALLVFDDAEQAHYIGNCERGDMIKALRESADRLERREDTRRAGE